MTLLWPDTAFFFLPVFYKCELKKRAPGGGPFLSQVWVWLALGLEGVDQLNNDPELLEGIGSLEA